MLSKTIHILFPVIKVFGLSANFYEAFFNVFTTMEIDVVSLTYTAAIEGLFIFLKSSHFEVPQWLEVAEELF